MPINIIFGNIIFYPDPHGIKKSTKTPLKEPQIRLSGQIFSKEAKLLQIIANCV